ncbi:hypothetical protein LCGC14_2763840 [marine sediment metagenome]|uniref:Uncharacterized protein n=1 Tax=marine sediment metagenome TaxID=412755 RepID=A0A0F8YY59_9ZZZZ
MTDTIKHTNYKITPNCSCNSCNPQRYHSIKRKKNAKEDFEEQINHD